LQTRSSLHFRTHLLRCERCQHNTERVIMRRLHRPRHHAQRSTPAPAARSPTPSSCRTLLARGPARPPTRAGSAPRSRWSTPASSDSFLSAWVALRSRRPQSDQEGDERLQLAQGQLHVQSAAASTSPLQLAQGQDTEQLSDVASDSCSCSQPLLPPAPSITSGPRSSPRRS